MIELVEHNALHLDVGDFVLLGDELFVHDLERVDVARVLLLGPHHLPMSHSTPISNRTQLPRSTTHDAGS